MAPAPLEVAGQLAQFVPPLELVHGATNLWNWGMRRCDNQLVLRGENILHALQCFHVHFILAAGRAGDGLDEITVSLYDCICWCHCWLCQVLVFKIDRVTDSCPSCCLHKFHMCTIMLARCSKVPTVAGVFPPTLVPCRLDMELHCTFHGCQGHTSIIELPMMICVCTDIGGHICRPEQIEGEYRLWD